MEQIAGRSGQNISYDSTLGSFDEQVAAIVEQPVSEEITLELPESSPRQTLPEILLVPGATQKDTNPSVSIIRKENVSNNLPTLTDNCIRLPRGQFRAATNINRVATKFSRLGIPQEVGVLGNIGKILSKYKKEFDEALQAYKTAEEDISNSDRSLLCYSCEKRMRDILNTSSTAMLGAIISLAEVTEIDIKDIDQSAKLDINVPKHIDKETLQRLKKKVTARTIKFLLQNEAEVRSKEETLDQDLEKKKPLIQFEYHQRSQQIAQIYNESSFKEIFLLILNVPRTDNLVLSTTSISGKEDPNELAIIENTDRLHEFAPNVLQLHQFDLKDLTQFPDYQVARHYLARINTWIRNYLLNKDDSTWKMIIYQNPELRKIFELANKLLGNIKLELQTDWKKEVRDKLDYMTNDKNKWKGKSIYDRGPFHGYFKLEGHFFSEKGWTHDDLLSLFSLNGESLGREYHNVYSHIYHPKNAGNFLAIINAGVVLDKENEKPPGAELFDIDGNILRTYCQTSEPDEAGNKVGVYETSFDKVKKMDLLNLDNQIILQDCTSISITFANEARVIEKDGNWFIFSSKRPAIPLDEYQNIFVTERYGFITIVGHKKDGSYVLLDSFGEVISDKNYIYTKMSTELTEKVGYTLEAETETGQIVHICLDGHIFRWNGRIL